MITYGKATEHDGRETLPFAVNISHAAADGWHTSQFLHDLQALLDKQAFDKAGLIYGMGHAVYSCPTPRQPAPLLCGEAVPGEGPYGGV